MTLKYEGGSITVGNAQNALADFVCDGVDDDVQINAAIDECYSRGGGEVCLLPGEFNLKRQITLKSNVVLLGVKNSSIVNAPTDAGNGMNGSVSISSQDNIAVKGIKFVLGGNWTAIASFGHENLEISDCLFTGDTSATGCVIHLCGQSGYGQKEMNRTTIMYNKFIDINANSKGVIRLYPRDTNTLSVVSIEGNTFENTFGKCIYLDAYSSMKNVRIIDNRFINIKGNSTGTNYAVAVHGGLAVADVISDVLIQGNYYSNTRTTTTDTGIRYSFAQIYASSNIKIIGNTAIAACAEGNDATGMFFAPGAIDAPLKNFIVSGNYVEGFDAFWDPDSMENGVVSNNIVKSCYHPVSNAVIGVTTGYGTQENIDIHNNIYIIDSVSGVPEDKNSGAIMLGPVDALGIKIHDNMIIDSRETPRLKYAVVLRGLNNFTGTEIYRNKITVKNGTTSDFYYKEYEAAVLPTYVEDNIVVEISESISPSISPSVSPSISPSISPSAS